MLAFAGYAAFLGIVVLLAWPFGKYLASVFEGRPSVLTKLFGPIERLVYRACGVDPEAEQSWKSYTISFLAFSLVGTLVLYAILRLQNLLPFYDPKVVTTAMTPDLAANSAMSFSTTTTWQAYSG